MSSLHAPIKAEEQSLGFIFSKNYLFVIPKFQRPFSWAKDNFERLFMDIYESMRDVQEGQGGYFLGSMVLWNERGNIYDVIDGQQRLASLTLLLAVIRDLLRDEKFRRTLHEAIFQEEDPVRRIPEVERLKPWDELLDKFRKYVYTEGGTKAFLEDFRSGRIQCKDEDDPVYRMKEAIETYYKLIEEVIPEDEREEELKKFVQYLFNNVYVVVIKTASFGSAIRLFNVLNTRGMPLSPTDIIKATNLEAISDPVVRDIHADKWIDLEGELGREELESLLSYVRMIYAREKARRALHEEYDKLYSSGKLKKGEVFFNLIHEYADIYKSKILSPEINVRTEGRANRYRVLSHIMRRYLPFSEWIPPLLAFYKKFYSDELLVDFLDKLEKKAVIEWMAGFTSTERVTSFSRIIKLVDESDDPRDVINRMLTYRSREVRERGRVIDYTKREELEGILDSTLNRRDFYKLKGGKMAKYILLRLDMEAWDLEGVIPQYTGVVTVEHILPRTPSPDSEWVRKFDEKTRAEWVDRLGNLVLLSGSKNSRAANYDFRKKKEVYFSRKWTHFRLTQELQEYDDWNIETLKKRHNELVYRVKNIYLK